MGMDEENFRETVDFNQISSEIGINLDTTIDLLKMLFVQTYETNAKLHKAAETGNYQDMIVFSHDIKGSCGNFRLADIYQASAEIEMIGKSGGDCETALQLSSKIGHMLDLYQEELKKYHDSTQGDSCR